jgi:penicillin-binding protein 1A
LFVASKNTGRKSKRKKPIWVRRAKQAMAFGTIVFLGAFATLFVMFLLKLREAEELLQTPEFQDRMEAVTRPPTRVVTADGVELFRISAENRIAIKDLDEVPVQVRNAMLAAEDKRFYEHPGVDNVGLMRAFFSIFKEGRVSQGGSTITMQLAKRLFSGNERSLQRKVQDIAYAYAIEKYKTKDQILLLYLNQVYFGEGAHGIAAASQVYFGKSFKKLTPGEAAILARCVRLPSRDNPIKDLEGSIRNRDVVLGIMHDEGMLDEAQYRAALAEVPKINHSPPQTTAFYKAGYGKHFVAHVLDVIKHEMPDLDLKNGGYLIQTTVQSKLQKVAEQMTRETVKEFHYFKVNQGAFVAMDADGKILCEVGGVDYDKNQYNRITQGYRQPGSAFKAIVYATGFQQGVITGPYSYISNARYYVKDKWTGEVWDPKNASPRENAPGYEAIDAFKLSVNRPAIHLAEDIGLNTVIQYARENFGIKSKLEPFLPLAIGAEAVRPIEMLEAYSVFMLRGDRVKPYPITRIVAPSGEVVKQFHPQKFTSMLSPAVCDTMDELLAAVVTSGTGTNAAVVPNARGKTGTTNDARDAWFCGYANGIVGVGWVGNEQMVKDRKTGKMKLTPVPMHGSAYGGTITAKLWARVMKPASTWFGSTTPPPAPSTVASTVPPVRKTDGDLVKPPVAEPISKPVDETPGPPVDTPPDGTPPVKNDESGGTVDMAEVERRQKEAERLAEQERQRALLREEERQKERDRRKQQQEDQRNSATVTVEVCADSGLPANMYCPETVTRTFPKDRVPNRVCRVHGPD